MSPTGQFAVLSLVVLVLLGSLLAGSLSAQLERQMEAAVADMIGHEVTAIIRPQIASIDLQTTLRDERYRAFDTFLHQNVLSSQIVRVKVWNSTGTVIYADDPALVGQSSAVVAGEFRAVLSTGDVVAGQAVLQTTEHSNERSLGRLLEIFVPVVPRDAGAVMGAYEVYLYFEPISQTIRQSQASIWASTSLALLGLWLGLIGVFVRASRTIAEERQRAQTDPLTGLNNRRVFQAQIALEYERSRRYQIPFSVLILDLDHFKSYNDTYGHPAGDAALCDLALRLRQELRTLDVVARYGGEEFAILLPGADLAAAETTAERLRTAVAGRAFARSPLTVSIGGACSLAPELLPSVEAIIAEADAALYQAKTCGRNRVCLAPLKALWPA